MSKYSEDIKRKDRAIENCQDIRSVLADLVSEKLTIDEAKTMLYRAFAEERAEGYRNGFSKQKQIKR